jgi:DNA-binding NtrC family response regulator
MVKNSFEFLIIEDDELARISLSTMLINQGLVSEAATAKEAKQLLGTKEFDLVFIDLDLEEDLIGLELIDLVIKNNAYAIVLSGRQEDACIEAAYKRGCQDYLNKPFDKNALELVMKKFKFLQGQGRLSRFFSNEYITQDEGLVEDLQVLNEVLISEKNVFISGATGTGKTLIAKYIHELAFENTDKFIHLNCSELPVELMEAELFGYEEGAFSGAKKATKGKLTLADGGTLFLDEIATMPMSLQQKLLKALDEKSFYPLGSERSVESNFRLVSATCEDLKEKVKAREFREDLYYRVTGFDIHLKNLEDRKNDIPLLIKHFLRQGPRRVVINEEAMTLLQNYSWPGNIRELRQVVEVLQTKPQGIIAIEDLPESIHQKKELNDFEKQDVETLLNESQIKFISENGLKVFIESIENEVINHFYKKNDEKVRQTLGDLNISNSAFYRIMDRIKGEEA